MAAGRHIARAGAALLALGLAAGARAQGGPPAETRQLNADVAYSLFLLTNGGFTSLGHADVRDDRTTSRLDVLAVPLRATFETGALGPIELRLNGGYGEATTTTTLGGATERQFISLWNLRLDVGRPIALTPGLTLTPSVGLGAQHWSGKVDRRPAGGAPDRLDFWTDALVAQVGAILEYRYRWDTWNIRPGVSASYVNLSQTDGRLTLRSTPPLRGRATIEAESVVLRAATRVDGPLPWSIGDTPLRWQGFVVGSHSTADVGLFRWSVEFGAAIGAELGTLGRRLVGFDPGELYLGVSYITGENLSGVRANLGFRF